MQWSRKCTHVCIVQTGLFIHIMGETRSRIKLRPSPKCVASHPPTETGVFVFLLINWKKKEIRLTVFFTFLAGVLGPLHMSLVTGLVRLPIRMHVVLSSYAKFQPGRPGWNSRNKTKIVEHKLVSSATAVRLFKTLVTLLQPLKRQNVKNKHYAISVALLRGRCKSRTR